MLAEKEGVIDLEQSVLIWVAGQNFRQEPSLNTSILSVVLRIFAYFNCNFSSVLLHVSALENLAEGANSKDFVNNIAISKLFTDLTVVATVLISYV